jgi:hypothetical protein
VRFRRSRGIERQQLKWFTSAAALAPLPFLVYEVAPGAFALLLAFILPLVPISVGIAILRYRLYEIDRIINRTLVYGLLTAVLGLGYMAGSLVSILVGLGRARRAGWSRRRPWRPRYSSRPGAASRPSWIGALTDADTRPPRPSRRSPPACVSRSTWTPVDRTAGSRGPDHGADPGLAVASTLPTRPLGHSSR